MTTTVGPMTLELDADNAPKTVENFLSYVSSGFYDDTIFTGSSTTSWCRVVVSRLTWSRKQHRLR